MLQNMLEINEKSKITAKKRIRRVPNQLITVVIVSSNVMKYRNPHNMKNVLLETLEGFSKMRF